MLIRLSREGSDLVDNVWKNRETIRETEGPCPWPDLKTSIRLLTEHLAIFPSFLEWHWQAVSVTLEFNLQIIAISPKPTQQHLTACSNRFWKGTKRQTISLPLGWGCSQPYVAWVSGWVFALLGRSAGLQGRRRGSWRLLEGRGCRWWGLAEARGPETKYRSVSLIPTNRKQSCLGSASLLLVWHLHLHCFISFTFALCQTLLALSLLMGPREASQRRKWLIGPGSNGQLCITSQGDEMKNVGGFGF